MAGNDAPTMGGIRNVYAAMGAENYYTQHGADYRNPHFPTLCEVLPKMLDAMLVPALREGTSTTGEESTSTLEPMHFTCLDFCCGAGEFSRILNAWCERRGQKGQPTTVALTGAD
eukprot:1907-Pyramimonas_sp.AAC.2